MYKCTVLNDKGGRVCVPLFYIRFSYIGIASIDFGSIVEGGGATASPLL